MIEIWVFGVRLTSTVRRKPLLLEILNTSINLIKKIRIPYVLETLSVMVWKLQ